MKKTAGSKRRRIEEEQMIILMDGNGHYYELPRATLERSRVPADRQDAVEARLKDVPEKFIWIHRTAVPGSVAAAPFEGGRVLHYAGFYLGSIKTKKSKR
jgi:hypothetical protein